MAIVELDASDKSEKNARLLHITDKGARKLVRAMNGSRWGSFLRYNYLRFDFSDIQEEGVYMVEYGNTQSNPFSISADIYRRHVWQPTLEDFLPVQMCHMRVNEAYRVWHGLCHMDDALMAPVDSILFDGYRQGPSTLTRFKPGDPVPGLNTGGGHDAGDDDRRVESQAGTVQLLSLAWEEFRPEFDATTINQRLHQVDMHKPDGKPDMLQQIEHGVITILGGYENLVRVYRGIISPTIPQYTLVGDVSTQTNNLVYKPSMRFDGTLETIQGIKDDRMVYTEEHPSHEFSAIQGLACAARVLKV
jgi:hypothetical protein